MWAHLLNEVLKPYPEVHIVLSTNWVRRRGFTWVKNSLPIYFRERVIGATWHSMMLICNESGFKSTFCWYDEASRFQQIQKYVTRDNLTSWIVLDDLHDQTEQWSKFYQKRLILTDPAHGISDLTVIDHKESILKTLKLKY